MKTQISFLVFLFLTTYINAQIPGGNFETWQTATFEYPQHANWTVYHQEAAPEKIGLLEKSGDASDGNYAIKFNTFGTYDYGYVLYGEVGEDGPSGGIPFADDPTQVTISYKCNMATGDSAQVWVWLYSGGSRITEDYFKVGGKQSVYKDTTFNLSAYAETPDSLMFAVASGDPNANEIMTDGNEVYFDNVRLNGTDNLQLPDNSFESWASIIVDYTAEMHSMTALCEKSDDAYSGDYALKMSTQHVEWDDVDDEIDKDSYVALWGRRYYIQTSKADWELRITGGLPVHARKDTLVFYYIYIPPAGVTDTAEVSLKFDKDSIEVVEYWNILLAADTYTKFEIPYDLDNVNSKASVDADSMILELESSKWRENWVPSDVNIEGSRLYIDYMYFKSQLYTVTATAGSNGTVTPVDTSIVQGGSLTFTITPDDDYTIDSVVYNGVNITVDLVQDGSDYTYTADNITENGTLTASFITISGIIDNRDIRDNISVFPNPTSDILYITGATVEYTVHIISVTGAVVYQSRISGNSSIDISHIPAGMYVVKMNNSIQGKILKK